VSRGRLASALQCTMRHPFAPPIVGPFPFPLLKREDGIGTPPRPDLTPSLRPRVPRAPRLTPGRPDRRRDLRRQQCETIHLAKRESLHPRPADIGARFNERQSIAQLV
jgi:hypothetical protein